MGPPSSSAQPSSQNYPHAPPLLGAWAHALPSVHLTAQPSLFYASSAVQPLHPSSQLQPTHRSCPPVTDSHHKICQIYSFTQRCLWTLYNNLTSMVTELTNSITNRGLKQASRGRIPNQPSYQCIPRTR